MWLAEIGHVAYTQAEVFDNLFGFYINSHKFTEMDF